MAKKTEAATLSTILGTKNAPPAPKQKAILLLCFLHFDSSIFQFFFYNEVFLFLTKIYVVRLIVYILRIHDDIILILFEFCRKMVMAKKP